jgi:hypothetical protein
MVVGRNLKANRIMADPSSRIAPAHVGPSAATGPRKAAGLDTRAAAGPGGRSNVVATPAGPRGKRMLSPDTSPDSLDRSAPRGTYIDILV